MRLDNDKNDALLLVDETDLRGILLFWFAAFTHDEIAFCCWGSAFWVYISNLKLSKLYDRLSLQFLLIYRKCQVVERGPNLEARQGLVPAAPVCSSPSAESTVSFAAATTPAVSEQVPPCTWLPSWSTCLPRSWSWQATPRETTRRAGSTPAIFSWLSATTRSWTVWCAVSPSHREASVTTAYVIITVYVISTACVIKNQLLM